MIVHVKPDPFAPGQFLIVCDDLPAVGLSMAMTVPGGWKRAEDGILYVSLLNLVDAVMAENHVSSYELSGHVEAIRAATSWLKSKTGVPSCVNF